MQTYRSDDGDGDDYSEWVLEATVPQGGRAHDTGGWLAYYRGVLRACRGVGEKKKKDRGVQTETVQVAR